MLHLILMLNAIKILMKKIPNLKLVVVSKQKNIFAKGYTQNWSEEGFIITKIKNTVAWNYVTSDLNGKPIAVNQFVTRNKSKII